MSLTDFIVKDRRLCFALVGPWTHVVKGDQTADHGKFHTLCGTRVLWSAIALALVRDTPDLPCQRCLRIAIEEVAP